MNKIGRNDPCPCGSGKKYKRCCLAKDQQVESAALAAAQAAAAAEEPDDDEELDVEVVFDLDDELEKLSNSVLDLIHAGKIDEAERAARDLLERFPEVHDGYDRLGMVYEARGQRREAADCYRRVIEFVRNHAEDYEAGFETTFQKLVDELDPPPAA